MSSCAPDSWIPAEAHSQFYLSDFGFRRTKLGHTDRAAGRIIEAAIRRNNTVEKQTDRRRSAKQVSRGKALACFEDDEPGETKPQGRDPDPDQWMNQASQQAPAKWFVTLR